MLELAVYAIIAVDVITVIATPILTGWVLSMLTGIGMLPCTLAAAAWLVAVYAALYYFFVYRTRK